LTIESAATVMAVAFLVTTSMLFVLRPLALAVGLVDTPSGHKRHTGDVPVIGGIAIFIGVLLAALAGPDINRNAAVILSMAAFMCMVGVVDDRFDLKPWVRLLAHLSAAVVLVLGTNYSVEGFGKILGFVEFQLGPLSVPFTVIACVALVNACNMLDGMDGLAGGVSLVAFSALAAVAVESGLSGSALVSCSMVGALSGFLLFNLPSRVNRPIRTFMGDAGSTVLGFTLAAVSLILIQPDKAGMAPAYVLWFVPIPVFELFSSTVRRVLNGHSPLYADNGHFHHRLLAAGFSVRLIFLLYFVVSVLCATLGLIAHREKAPEWLLFAGFLGLFALWLLFIRYSETIGSRLPQRLRRDLENLHV
jgi:UDP-GlcNAc:undecaprenyl-phosphate GlcNAc-1-phosphate transferase